MASEAETVATRYHVYNTRDRQQHESIAALVRTIRATCRETELLYALRGAAEEAVKQGDLTIIARALDALRLAEMLRRST